RGIDEDDAGLALSHGAEELAHLNRAAVRRWGSRLIDDVDRCRSPRANLNRVDGRSGEVALWSPGLNDGIGAGRQGGEQQFTVLIGTEGAGRVLEQVVAGAGQWNAGWVVRANEDPARAEGILDLDVGGLVLGDFDGDIGGGLEVRRGAPGLAQR